MLAPANAPEIAEAAALLQEGAAALSLHLDADVLSRFLFYGAELLKWNTRVNLTGLRTISAVVIKHFLDSLAVWPWVRDMASLADIGTGAGFPGLPLKLVLPQIRLTLVEASGKKTAFLHYLVAHLGISGVEVRQLHLTPALAKQWGAVFAGVITRATFPLRRYLELAAPLVVPGGHILAMRGPRLDQRHWHQAQSLASRVHCSPPTLQQYSLPLTSEPRSLIIWDKITAELAKSF